MLILSPPARFLLAPSTRLLAAVCTGSWPMPEFSLPPGDWPELLGSTLRLRTLRREDAAGILALLRDPEVSRFFLWEPPRDLKTARAYVAGFQEETAVGWAYHFAVEEHARGALLGVANLYHINAVTGEAEIGIWLGRAHWGQGAQQEVNQLLLQFGFGQLGLRRLMFRVAVENTRAQAAFRKLGASDWGCVELFSRRQDRMVEHRVFGVEDEEWQTKNASG
jgi:[ribosomal protein S5]-alanine N-acetyltransferase